MLLASLEGLSPMELMLINVMNVDEYRREAEFQYQDVFCTCCLLCCSFLLGQMLC